MFISPSGRTLRPSPLVVKFSLLPLLSFALAGPITSNAAVIISENFGGAVADPLNGTSADVFDSAITAAGGNSTWNAHEGTGTAINRSYAASGALITSGTGTNSGSYLSLGTYINDARGTATGKFILQATFTQPTDGGASAWISLGFLASPSTTANFTASSGYATAILRKSDAAADYFGGAGVSNNNGTALTISGTNTFTITLDLTPAGG